MANVGPVAAGAHTAPQPQSEQLALLNQRSSMEPGHMPHPLGWA